MYAAGRLRRNSIYQMVIPSFLKQLPGAGNEFFAHTLKPGISLMCITCVFFVVVLRISEILLTDTLSYMLPSSA